MAVKIKPVKENLSEFAKRIKALRLQKGISQGEIAKKIGIHKINYGRYERGESQPSAETLTKLADVLNVSTDYLLEGEEQDAIVANFEDRDLLKIFSKVETLPLEEKETIKDLIDAYLKRKQLQQLMSSKTYAS